MKSAASACQPDIWKLIYSVLPTQDVGKGRIVCKEFSEMLRPLVQSITIKKGITQEDLEILAGAYPELVSLAIDLEYDDDTPAVDFTTVQFPRLQRLSLSCCPLKTLYLRTDNTPVLESLDIHHQGSEAAEAFNLELPELKSAFFEHFHVDDSTGFGTSLSACPKLETFTSYKLWGLGTHSRGVCHKLRLPLCTKLGLWRADLQRLELWASNLRDLNLQACHDIRRLKLHGRRGRPMRVSMVNTTFPRDVIVHLESHPRVGAGRLMREFPEDGSDLPEPQDDSGLQVGSIDPSGEDESDEEGDGEEEEPVYDYDEYQNQVMQAVMALGAVEQNIFPGQ